MTMANTEIGLDVNGKLVVLHDLEAGLRAAGLPVPNGLTVTAPPQPLDPSAPPPPIGVPQPYPDGARLFTYDDDGNPIELPPEALAIIDAHTA